MSDIVRFSEASALAMHTMALLSMDADKRMSVREIVEMLPASENHLAKVLQRLARAGLVESVRGPRGGWRASQDPSDVTLLVVYEAIEGPLSSSGCMFPTPRCEGTCILGDSLHKLGMQLHQQLASTRLSDIPDVFGRKNEHHA